MKEFLMIIIEGKEIHEIRNRFDELFSQMCNSGYNFSVEDNKIKITNIKTTNPSLEIKGKTIQAKFSLRFMLAIPLDFAKEIIKPDVQEKVSLNNKSQYSIISIPLLKATIFKASGASIFMIENNIVQNAIKYYREKFESKGLKFNADTLPFYIDYEKEYQIPMELYKYAHDLDAGLAKYMKEVSA